MDNRRITVREVGGDVDVSYDSCQAIFSTFLCMRRVTVKFVWKLLNFEQKQRRMDIAQELLNDVNDNPEELKWVITGDKTWVYDVETKV